MTLRRLYSLISPRAKCISFTGHVLAGQRQTRGGREARSTVILEVGREFGDKKSGEPFGCSTGKHWKVQCILDNTNGGWKPQGRMYTSSRIECGRPRTEFAAPTLLALKSHN